jgi:formate hydrogenlyase subunit 6/NADH:ubiquinone oxidoreductase subunit I
MGYKITDECVACGACSDACPADAIKEGDKYTIDQDACISCGACVDTCPTSAIVEE